MSSLSSITILLLLCISLLHSCNGRNLLVEINEDHMKQLQYLNKANDQKAIITDSPNVDPSLLNKLEEAERGSTVKQIRINDDTQKQSESDQTFGEEMKEQRMLRSKDGDHGHDSLVSVSFRVPRNNEGLDHHPGFNLDYSPPKTHPPIHN